MNPNELITFLALFEIHSFLITTELNILRMELNLHHSNALQEVIEVVIVVMTVILMMMVVVKVMMVITVT